ncbi:MAG: hypothetical protein ACLQVI_34170 [Polyangiaceae bacterium]
MLDARPHRGRGPLGTAGARTSAAPSLRLACRPAGGALPTQRVHICNQGAEACTDADLSAVIRHNESEEVEHATMILEWIRRRSPSNPSVTEVSGSGESRAFPRRLRGWATRARPRRVLDGARAPTCRTGPMGRRAAARLATRPSPATDGEASVAQVARARARRAPSGPRSWSCSCWRPSVVGAWVLALALPLASGWRPDAAPGGGDLHAVAIRGASRGGPRLADGRSPWPRWHAL